MHTTHQSWLNGYKSTFTSIEKRHAAAALVSTDEIIKGASRISKRFLLAHWAVGDEQLRSLAQFIYEIGDDLDNHVDEPFVVVENDTKDDLLSDASFVEGSLDLRVGRVAGHMLHSISKVSFKPKNPNSKGKAAKTNKALGGGFYTNYSVAAATVPGSGFAIKADIISSELDEAEPTVRVGASTWEPGITIYDGRLPWPSTPRTLAYNILKRETMREYFIGAEACQPIFEGLGEKLVGVDAERIVKALETVS